MFLITGITGALGVEVLRILLRDSIKEDVTVIIRAKSEEHLVTRWTRLLKIASDGAVEPSDVPNFVPLIGDITKVNLGLSESAVSGLVQRVEKIMHIAATVDFDEPLDSCRIINVEGTRHLLTIATDCSNLKQFAHISTLYVAGKRSGDVYENELEHNAGFITNGYEQSKYEAEVLVREYLDILPISIYRMSLLMGCERDGYVHDYGAVQRYLMFMYKGIAPCFPGYADCPLDFLPHDYSAECLMTLFEKKFKKGETYQISSGKTSVALEPWLNLTAQTYAKHSRSWKNGSYNVPDIVEWSTYQLYKKTIFTIDNMEFMKVIRILDSCAEELYCPKVFHREKLNEALGVDDNSIPRYEEYYPRILDHCIETNWGLLLEYSKV